MTINRQWCMGLPENGNGFSLTQRQFVYREAPVPEIGENQMLIRATHFAPDPMVHAWAQGIMPGLAAFRPIPSGSPLRGAVGGVILSSTHPEWAAGQRVTGNLDWAEYSVSGGTDHLGHSLERVPAGVATETALGTLGMNGLCAYFGLFDIGRPLPGDTVLVSGASGAIGSVAAQLAKLAGARVIGVAGGAAKCAMLDELGLDATIDYKAGRIAEKIAAACPEGVDVFFDNVGGDILNQVLLRINQGARIVICGAMAHFSGEVAAINHHVILASRAATMKGFYYFDEVRRWPVVRARLARFLSESRLRELFDIVEGFEKVPSAAVSQFTGTGGGRLICRIADETAANPG